MDSSHQRENPPPSLFNPSTSFSQAFSFVKSSEFYSPPPPSTPVPSASGLLNHALTSVRHVNNTGVVTLGSTFGVRRLYDTFHEPFRRVVPNIPLDPDSAMRKDAEPSSSNQVDEVATEAEEAGKRKNKEPYSTVKSALSVAFAKYADKVGKNKRKAGKEIKAKRVRDIRQILKIRDL